MSDIDEVIRRSREAGQFSERKEFTIAKDRAIEKMRKFALKTPSHYILEVIQSAVANGASYIDIFVDSETTLIAWTGGVFELNELQQIFDYLFTDNEDRESASIRQLSVGINALLAFNPQQIIIESGDGTLEGTGRIEIDPKNMHVAVGRPEKALKGTFISATKKKGESEEEKLIGERCLTLNIPIIVNDKILFGFSSVRSPNLLGVRKSLKFDEGDFYGTIGLAHGQNTDNFRILTHGVWIQTTKRDLGLPHKFGGVIAFDHLNKTVDHAAIVEDKKWEEMWARVSLLARDLVSTDESKDITMKLKGQWTDLSTCRKAASVAGGAILFSGPDVDQSLIPEYEKIYGYPGFFVTPKNLDLVTNLLGDRNVFIAEGTAKELAFLRKPKTSAPKGPFFLDPLEIGEFDVGVFSFLKLSNIDSLGEITIFTPRTLAPTRVEFIDRGRLSESVTLDNFTPGFLVRVKLNEGSVSQHAEKSAMAIIENLTESLNKLSVQIADEYFSVVEPDTTLAFHVMRALESTTIFAIENERFVIRRLGLETRAILNAPIFRSVDGDPKSITDIVDLMNEQFGIVYGCLQNDPGDLKNLNTSRILLLNPHEESELVSIIGDASYVRVDQRDVLATHTDEKGNQFTIRDIAVGLGEYDSKFICCENNQNITLNVAVILIGQLKARVSNIEEDPEMRRQSLRHLIWILTHENSPPSLIKILAPVPLFRDTDERVVEYLSLHSEIEMNDGWPVGPVALPQMKQSNPQTKTKTLALNPFVFHTLMRKKKIGTQTKVEKKAADLRSSVLSIWVENERETGTVSLMPRTGEKTLAIINPHTKEVDVFDSVAENMMCAGEFFIKDEDVLAVGANLVVDTFLEQAIKLFGKAAHLIDESTDLAHIHELAEPALFGASPLILAKRNGAHLRLTSRFPEVTLLLNCRLFTTKRGAPLSASSLTMNFSNPLDELHEDTPPYQREWLEKILRGQFRARKHPRPSDKLDWKIYFLQPRMNEISDEDWITSFASELTGSQVSFFTGPPRKRPVVFLQSNRITINTNELHTLCNDPERKNRSWLAVEVLNGLKKIGQIDMPQLMDFHSQIADLVLEHSTTQN